MGREDRRVSEDFGKFIKYLWKFKGLTITDVSYRTGISFSYICRLKSEFTIRCKIVSRHEKELLIEIAELILSDDFSNDKNIDTVVIMN
jgi:hypothetical protein